jgi:hypothetical protein
MSDGARNLPVRQAVEALIQASSLPYSTAVRRIMQLVVRLFAEARGLPIDGLPLEIDDATVPRLTELLTRSNTDFSSLPPEYIGILYEGLLDGGTRKGAGTFYTPPQLAEPTIRRTLQPLTHDPDGRPKLPEQILALKVCDPAMGSGSFLISALHWLTDALHASVLVHGRTREHQPKLARQVIEHCIYGVDLDPVAVELARLALWLDTRDAHLPLDCLDRKLSCGNALNPNRADLLGEEHRFFHWQHEFPDVFTGPNPGFDAIVGNPPWDVQKPNSKEFFSNIDPHYRSLGKQEALRWQAHAFETSPELEQQWIAYQARFKALSNWVRSAFRHQGSADLNSYKLFLEVAHALLRERGRLGMIVPSGLYGDHGTTSLRELLLDRCRWEWLFSFENRDSIFAIDGRFKFAAIVIERGGTTDHIHAAFMRRELADWDAARPPTLAYPRARIAQFSPKSKVILELSSERDLEVLHELYENGVLLGDTGPDGWGVEYAREFDTTLDSHLFPSRPTWEARGYQPDEHGHWHAGAWQPIAKFGPRPEGVLRSRDGARGIALEAITDTAFPIFEGRMIGLLDSCEKGWVRGKGRTAVWRDIPFDAKVVEPQWLIGKRELLAARKWYGGPKLAYMRISSSTNSRTAIATFLHGQPAVDSVFFLRSHTASVEDCLTLTGLFSSLVYDFGVRARLGGLNMSEFVIVETAVPRRSSLGPCAQAIRTITMRLALLDAAWYRTWWRHGARDQPLAMQWAVTAHERLRLRVILDALVANAHQLDADALRFILRDCDRPLAETRKAPPKGFWRVDKDQPPELRHTVLTQVAFHELKRDGLEHFLGQNDGHGWMLPETLRLADYGLGHDDRAKHPRAVASALGPRFHTWQLRQSVEESWQECRRHAELLEHVLPLPDP